MTFTEFMSILNGEYKETAGTSAKNQCVDLANAYIRYVLGLPIIEWTNAVDFPSKAGDDYEYILNTPTGVPKEGDLVIWGGTYGHIAIFIEGNAKRFTSFDENFPVGSPCHVQEHKYVTPRVLGWLHPKVVQPNLEVQLTTMRKERDDNHDDRMALYSELGFEGKFNRMIAVTEIQQLKEIAKKSVEKDEELKKLREELSAVKEELRIAKEKITELQTAVQNNQAATDIVSSQIDNTIEKAEDIEKKIDTSLKDDEPLWWEKLIVWIKKLFGRG